MGNLWWPLENGGGGGGSWGQGQGWASERSFSASPSSEVVGAAALRAGAVLAPATPWAMPRAKWDRHRLLGSLGARRMEQHQVAVSTGWSPWKHAARGRIVKPYPWPRAVRESGPRPSVHWAGSAMQDSKGKM